MNISTLTARKLAAAIEKQAKITSAQCDKFIAAGRGHETFSDVAAKSDPMSIEYMQAAYLERDLLSEKSRRIAYHGKLTAIKN